MSSKIEQLLSYTYTTTPADPSNPKRQPKTDKQLQKYIVTNYFNKKIEQLLSHGYTMPPSDPGDLKQHPMG